MRQKSDWFIKTKSDILPHPKKQSRKIKKTPYRICRKIFIDKEIPFQRKLSRLPSKKNQSKFFSDEVN